MEVLFPNIWRDGGGVILLFWCFFKFLLISFKYFQCFPVAETNYVLSE